MLYITSKAWIQIHFYEHFLEMLEHAIINGEPSPLGGSTGPGWKAFVVIIDVQYFFWKHNETSFIRDQYHNLADDGSPLIWFYSTTWCPRGDSKTYGYAGNEPFPAALPARVKTIMRWQFKLRVCFPELWAFQMETKIKNLGVTLQLATWSVVETFGGLTLLCNKVIYNW